MLNLSKQERFRQRYKTMRPGYRPALEIYKDLMTQLVAADTVLLDAGCGPGGLVAEYQGRAKQVFGVDRNVSGFRHLAEIPTLVESDLDALPLADNSISLITCSWVFEHLRDPERVFSEMARVLRPGGHLLFITPNKHNYVVRLRQLIPNLISKRLVYAIYARDEEFINPTYYRANTAADVRRTLAAAGLESERFEHVSDPSYLALNEPLFRLSVLIESLLDRSWPQGKVHLVGLYRKPGG